MRILASLAFLVCALGSMRVTAPEVGRALLRGGRIGA